MISRAIVKKMIDMDCNADEIAKLLGCSPESVQRIGREIGYPVRPRERSGH